MTDLGMTEFFDCSAARRLLRHSPVKKSSHPLPNTPVYVVGESVVGANVVGANVVGVIDDRHPNISLITGTPTYPWASAPPNHLPHPYQGTPTNPSEAVPYVRCKVVADCYARGCVV